jgi:hypothetical protein
MDHSFGFGVAGNDKAKINLLAASYEVWNGIDAVVYNYHGSLNR